MSQHIVLNNWSGPDAEDASRKLAKVFRMSPTRSATIIDELAGGTSWQFEHTISDEQAPTARAFLEKLGFSVEIVSAVAPSAPPGQERHAEAGEPDTAVEKKFPEPEPRFEEEEKPASPFAKWLGKLKPKKSPDAEAPAPAEKKPSFLSGLPFFKKKEKDAAPPPPGSPDRKP